jgi:hypothetical protein
MFERSNVSRSCPARRRLCCPCYAVAALPLRPELLASMLPTFPTLAAPWPGCTWPGWRSDARPPPNPSRFPCRFRQRPAFMISVTFSIFLPDLIGTLADALFPFLCDCQNWKKRSIRHALPESVVSAHQIAANLDGSAQSFHTGPHHKSSSAASSGNDITKISRRPSISRVLQCFLNFLYNVGTRGKFRDAADGECSSEPGVFQCCRVVAGSPGNSNVQPACTLLHAEDASAHAVVNEALATSALNIPDSAARQSRTAR